MTGESRRHVMLSCRFATSRLYAQSSVLRQLEDGRRECIDLHSVMIRAGIFHGYFIGH